MQMTGKAAGKLPREAPRAAGGAAGAAPRELSPTPLPPSEEGQSCNGNNRAPGRGWPDGAESLPEVADLWGLALRPEPSAGPCSPRPPKVFRKEANPEAGRASLPRGGQSPTSGGAPRGQGAPEPGSEPAEAELAPEEAEQTGAGLGYPGVRRQRRRRQRGPG